MREAPPPLEDLQARIRRARGAPEAGNVSPPASGAGLALRFGADLIAGVATGGGIGYLLDRWLGTLPLFLLLLLLLGVAAGFVNIWRTHQRMETAPPPEDGKDG